MKVVAIISIRNNAEYLNTLLQNLANQNIRVIIIDQESNDGTSGILSKYLGDPIEQIIKEPFDGVFSLERQLKLKAKIKNSSDADWIIHHDSDEILQSNVKGESLFEMIKRVDSLGYNSINFNEFVFIPTDPSKDFSFENYIEKMRFYYFFSPSDGRLNRVFKNQKNINNINSGGHELSGEDVNRYPENMILRHYISLSWEMLKQKYKNRRFSEEETKIGWHHNRLEINWDLVEIPHLSTLMYEPISGITTDLPYSKHFWQWGDEEE